MLQNSRSIRIVGYAGILLGIALFFYMALSAIGIVTGSVFLILLSVLGVSTIYCSFPILRIIKPEHCDDMIEEVVLLSYLPKAVYEKDAVLVGIHRVPDWEYKIMMLPLAHFVKRDREAIKKNFSLDTNAPLAITRLYIQKQETQRGPFLELVEDGKEIFLSQFNSDDKEDESQETEVL
jgi:hypothetical protein